MPALEVLSYGILYPINDTLIRALPSAGGRLFVSGPAASIDLSNDIAMANAKNVLPAAGAFLPGGDYVSAGFIRVNGGAAIVKVTKP
jgi:hypothetical protein